MSKKACIGLLLWMIWGGAGAQELSRDVMAALENVSPERLQALLPDLKRGGWVFYWRHTATAWDQEDQQPIVKENCATQRNLSEEGRQQAQNIGALWRKWHIPVAKVWTSPFCRCQETAKLAFGAWQVTDDLYFAVGLSKPERELKGKALRQLLAEPPKPGSNTVVVAHTANLVEATGLWPKPEGTVVLVRPEGQGQFKVVGKVDPESWALLESSLGRP